jgi:hypothetical protein
MTKPELTLPENKSLSAEERIQASLRTAMASPEKLIQWLEASGRSCVVFNARQLVEALPWPEGVSAFAQIVAAYRDHRSTIPTGETETIAGKVVDKFHTEALTVTELDRAIRYLISQASTLDSTWSLDRDPA